MTDPTAETTRSRPRFLVEGQIREAGAPTWSRPGREGEET